VAFGGNCYYLDGSGGACRSGGSLASQSVLTSIAALFAGKKYETQVSDDCCVLNADPTENWGMQAHCDVPGPFSGGDRSLGAKGCTNATIHTPAQLTLCVR